MQNKVEVRNESWDAFNESGPIYCGHNASALLEVPLSTSGKTSTCYRVERDGQVFFKKRLKAEYLSTPAYHELYRKEYEVGSRLDCPYLVRYVDFVDEGMDCYLLQEFVNGDTLQERMDSNPAYFRDPDAIHRFLLQLLQGLAYLHSRQIVHLDLKPSNIMLTKVNNDVRILDVGYCYSDDHQSHLGCSIAFAAPEQLDGTGNVDARTDIYAVGNLIQYILEHTGAHARQFRIFNRMMQRCLHVEKADRYQSVAEMIAELRQAKQRRKQAGILCASLLVVLLAAGYNLDAYRSALRWIRGYDFTYCGVCYRILSEQKRLCEAVDYQEHALKSRNNTDVTIEETVMDGDTGYRVVSIGDSAFVNRHVLQSVSIPSSVRHIGMSAFRNCTNLTTLYIPEGVTSIGSNAFCQLTSLSSIRYPSSAKVVPYFCFHQTALRSIELPEGITTIQQDAFVDCDSLCQVCLPSTLTELGRGIFFECDNLEEITLPAHVEFIGEYCFQHCPRFRRLINMATEPQRVVELFDEGSDIQVYVPDNAVETYRNAPYWQDFTILPLSALTD